MSKDLSKFLSLVLRHAPETIGIVLDEKGWTSVDTLILKASEAGKNLDRQTLFEVVETSDKKRFTLSPDQQRIRAAQGHSVEVDLNLTPSEPPPVLFHGTAQNVADIILVEGLKPGKRQHVHLSADTETATKVGMRHGKPVVFTVDAKRMHEDGIPFWKADNGVWLVDTVSPIYLKM